MFIFYFSRILRISEASILFLILFQTTLGSSSAYSAEQRFLGEWENAKKLYESGKFEEALQDLKSHPRDEHTYFYNLGTIHFRLKNLGPAVAYLEKSNRIYPHDVEIQSNLSLARSALIRSLGQERLDPASTWLEQMADRIDLDEVRATLGLIGLITLLFWIRTYFQTRDFKKAFLKPSSLFGVLGFSITVGVYCIQRWSASHPAAVCLEQLSIRSGPGQHYSELSRAEAGIKVRILGPTATSNPGLPSVVSDDSKEASSLPSSEIWQQVRFSANGIGWIKSSSLLQL